MGVEVQIENHINEVIKQIDANIKARMQDACYAVRMKAIDLIRTPSSGGRTYETYFYTDAQGRVRPVGHRDKPHRAAPPGQPPNTDTGELQKNIVVEISPDGLKGAVGTDKMHGLYQEMGTSKIEPRPWLKPAFEQSEGKIKEIFTQDFEKGGGIQTGFPVGD